MLHPRSVRSVINHQAEVNDPYLVVSHADHKVVRLDISMQMVRLVELLQTFEGLESYILQR